MARRQITLIARNSPTPHHASVTEALTANAGLLAALLEEGDRVMSARANGEPDPRVALREQQLAERHLHPTPQRRVAAKAS